MKNDAVFLCVDRDGLTGSLQLSIHLTRPDGGGHGYRIAGPKFSGTSKKVLHHQLTARDAAEFKDYLKAVANTDASNRSESTPPAIFADPQNFPPESGER